MGGYRPRRSSSPENLWTKRTTGRCLEKKYPVGSGVLAAADPDEEVADLADDEYDEPMVQATSSAQGESSAAASVGEVSTMFVQEEPPQRPAHITDSNIVEAGLSGDLDLDTLPGDYTRIEMIQRTDALGNTPAGTGSSSHLGSNLATDGATGKDE